MTLDFLWSTKAKLDFARAGKVDGGLTPLPAPIHTKLPRHLYIDGHMVTTSGYMTGVIVGDSATPFGLQDGDLYLASPSNGDQIEIGDVVLIKMTEQPGGDIGQPVADDAGRLKVRAVVDLQEDANQLRTVTFSDGKVRRSRPHDLKDVVAKIRYRIPAADPLYKKYVPTAA